MTTYRVRTWDTSADSYTPEDGLSCPSTGLTLAQLRQAVRELRSMGYPCNRTKHDGNSDPAVLIEAELACSACGETESDMTVCTECDAIFCDGCIEWCHDEGDEACGGWFCTACISAAKAAEGA